VGIQKWVTTTPMETLIVSVHWCIPKARGNVPLPRHCSLCKTPMETLMVCVRRCIPEMRGTIPLLMPVMAITEYQVPERITDGLCIVYTF
jgi:hypothetical protein